MGDIRIRQRGTFLKTYRFLKKDRTKTIIDLLKTFGEKAIIELKTSTPKRTGLTANSWTYEIENNDDSVILHIQNTNVVNQWCNIAVMLQYGHATRNGGWVEGIDYINPVLDKIYKEIDVRINQLYR